MTTVALRTLPYRPKERLHCEAGPFSYFFQSHNRPSRTIFFQLAIFYSLSFLRRLALFDHLALIDMVIASLPKTRAAGYPRLAERPLGRAP